MTPTRKSLVRVGTSGWNYPHWRGRFYPESLPPRRWFEHYCRYFDTVEINNTFYRLPETQTFDRWREAAPAGFVFAVKANRFLTHRKKLKEVAGPLQLLVERAERLQTHLGPILYQLPPRWKRNLERLRCFCELLPSRLLHVVEFREPDWLVDETFALLDQFGVGLCIHDLVERHPKRVTGQLVYVRFHGAGQLYGGSYRKDVLRRWADWLNEQTTVASRGVFVYFNNDAEAFAVKNALTLKELLAQ